MRFLFLLAFISTSCFAKEFVAESGRHLELIGVVQDNALELAEDINELSLKSSKPISMLINSPGGNVATGMIMVDSMRQAKARGVVFRCLSSVLSASMAFIILAECNERYSFSSTLLLWHEISLSVRSAKIRNLYTTLPPILDLQYRVDQDLIKTLRVSESFYQMHSHAETMWTAAELNSATWWSNFTEVIDSARIPGPNLYRFMNQEAGLFGSEMDSVNKIIERVHGLTNSQEAN